MKMDEKETDRLNAYISRIEDFEAISIIQQIKYMSYIYLKMNNTRQFAASDILLLFDKAHLKKPSNIHSDLNRLCSHNILLKNNSSYIFQRKALGDLDSEFGLVKPFLDISPELRELEKKIMDNNKRKFLEEAIHCYEIKAYRASIVMSWILAMEHLQQYIFENKLKEFNDELKKQRLKLKVIKTRDDFGEIKEIMFIEICRAAGVISGNVKKILDEKLSIRNIYAHPNSINITVSKATSFIEDLVENVIIKYT